MVKLTVLGSGTSSGVPLLTCSCAVCHSSNPKNKRLRSSCLFEAGGKKILVDTSPDLRQQALTHQVYRVDAVLYTHIHADHVHGIDELRVYNEVQKTTLPVYGNQNTIDHLVKNFGYIFKPSVKYPSLTPKLDPHVVTGLFDCVGVPVQAIDCNHGDTYITQNYRIGNIAWLTDLNGIPETSWPLLHNLDYLFIDGLRFKAHPTHFNLEKSLETALKIGAKKTYLIHLTHDYDHDVFNQTLPAGIELAYDGLTVEAS